MERSPGTPSLALCWLGKPGLESLLPAIKAACGTQQFVCLDEELWSLSPLFFENGGASTLWSWNNEIIHKPGPVPGDAQSLRLTFFPFSCKSGDPL